MNYLLIYVKFIDQIIINHDKHQDQCDIVLKSFVPKVVPQPWMPPTGQANIGYMIANILFFWTTFVLQGNYSAP